MHRSKIFVSFLLLVGSLGLLVWLIKTMDQQSKAEIMNTEVPVKMDIVNKRVISGILVPYKEVALTSEIAGIIDKLYVDVGDKVAPGAAIARIKVLPKSIEIESAQKAVHVAQLAQAAAEAKYQRSKHLFENQILSSEKYEQDVKAWKIACEEVTYAEKQLSYIQKGYIAGASGASSIIKTTIAGIVSELPCKEGSVIMERNSHVGGTTVATISDMSTILFQGKVSELEIAQLNMNMRFEVSLPAVKGKKFLTTLTKIAPKAIKNEDGGSIKFAIEGTVEGSTEDKAHIRAGYTATADIVLDKAINVLAIKEQCVQTEEAIGSSDPVSFVWVYENNKDVKKHVELGVSDGIYVEVKQGLTTNDRVIIKDDSY